MKRVMYVWVGKLAAGTTGIVGTPVTGGAVCLYIWMDGKIIGVNYVQFFCLFFFTVLDIVTCSLGLW